jgi:hypothetical protein
MIETYEKLVERARRMQIEGEKRNIHFALKSAIWSFNLEAFEVIAQIALEMGISEERINEYRSSKLTTELFTLISRANKGGNKTLAIRCLDQAIKEQDTEAIGHAAKVAEKIGIPHEIVKNKILKAVIDWKLAKKKDVYLLTMVARDLFPYVKEFLNPEFVADMEGR